MSYKNFIGDVEKLKRIIQEIEGSDSFSGGYGIDFKLEGFDKVIDGIEELIEDVEKIPSLYQEALDKAAIDVLPMLRQALNDAMESPTWPWDDGARDIIDTGALRDSLQLSYNKSTKKVSINYTAPYANLVQYGGYIQSGYNPSVRIYIPPRPWVDAVLYGGPGITAFPFEKLVTERALNALKKFNLE